MTTKNRKNRQKKQVAKGGGKSLSLLKSPFIPDVTVSTMFKSVN